MANLVKNRDRGTMNPWRDFLSVDNFFDSDWLKKWESHFPAVNVSENEKSYMIELAAPGFHKDDFKIKVDDDILTISAESKAEQSDEKNKEYTRREYSYNSFTRSFHLPDNVKDDSISANYKDGMLLLELPKSKSQVKASKQIAIN